MNKIIWIVLLLLYYSCSNNNNSKLTTINIKDTIVRLGSARLTDTLHYKFLIRNIGVNNLAIQNVSPSCGCVEFSWTKKAILPNESGYVSIAIKPKEKGEAVQTIVISTNTIKVFSTLKVFYNVY
ncbi:DUF1573 domain-containing protein [Mucilaginibacter mali]|uniref:DUF1573 domain-containing protein n=1 Tax=Mucilaginibacter mali TaxID=2740462 RepID=A0A7D4TMF8_9SPHI|nr:DUF1573 domain-containing protein [Mucilaginibacter mali]QKJ29114.1 DUF1573 domain-containing protein [Mucilaginibacter mali]